VSVYLKALSILFGEYDVLLITHRLINHFVFVARVVVVFASSLAGAWLD
jgi:hypothetical protein